MDLNIISIFKSIDGEVNAQYQGRVTTFIRLSQCNIRCKYCDTTYSFKKGTVVPLDDVVDEVLGYETDKVTITGGEPLLQLDAVNALIEKLLQYNKYVSIETNGTIAPTKFLHQGYVVSWVVDYKLPSSGQEDKMNIDAFARLSPNDFVKFLIADRADFDKSIAVRRQLEAAGCQAVFAYSPVEGAANKAQVAEWMINEGRGDEVFNLQLHKVIWPDCGQAMEK